MFPRGTVQPVTVLKIAPDIRTRRPDGGTCLLRPCLAGAKHAPSALYKSYPRCASGPAPPVCRGHGLRNIYLNAPRASAADLAHKSKFFYYNTHSSKSIPPQSRKSRRNLRGIWCFRGQIVHENYFFRQSKQTFKIHPLLFCIINGTDRGDIKTFSRRKS